MANNNNQHFVPKFYLRRFSEDQSSINLMLVSDGRVIEEASIKGQCSKNKYYDRDPKLDDFLRILETRASSFMSLFSGQMPKLGVSEKELEYFLCFLTTQIHRTPKSQKDGIEMDRQFRNIISRGFPEGAKFHKKLDIPPMDHVDMVKIAVKLYPQLFNLMMVIVDAPKGAEFITSDNPIVLLNKAGEQGKVTPSVGLASAGLILVYPISPKHLILFYDNGIYKVEANAQLRVHANRADVKRLNDLQFLNAMNAVYFRQMEGGFEKQRVRASQWRLETRVQLEEFVSISADKDNGAYRKFDADTDFKHGTSSIIAMSQNLIKTRLVCSFLKLRRRLIFEDNGSMAGTQRSYEFLDLVEKYNTLLKEKNVSCFRFLIF